MIYSLGEIFPCVFTPSAFVTCAFSSVLCGCTLIRHFNQHANLTTVKISMLIPTNAFWQTILTICVFGLLSVTLCKALCN